LLTHLRALYKTLNKQELIDTIGKTLLGMMDADDEQEKRAIKSTWK